MQSYCWILSIDIDNLMKGQWQSLLPINEAEDSHACSVLLLLGVVLKSDPPYRSQLEVQSSITGRLQASQEDQNRGQERLRTALDTVNQLSAQVWPPRAVNCC